MRTALLFACIASVASAQEVKDGVFTHKEHQIQFTVPKDWTVRAKDFEWGWFQALAEVVSADEVIGAVLGYEAAAMKVERYADALEKNMLTVKGVKTYKKLKEETLEGKKNGAWLLREYALDLNDQDYRRVVVHINKGKHNFHFTQWCYETQFEESKKTIYKNIDNLAYGEIVESKPARKAYKNADLGVALSMPGGWESRDKDFKFGDPNAVVEFYKSDEAFGVLAAIEFSGEAAAWADASIKAFEKSMENIKVLDAKSVGGWERRDFRADSSGHAIRFAMLFRTDTAENKGVYLYVWCAEENWDKNKAVFEEALASAKPATGEAAPADKPVTPPAGDGTAVPEDQWKGCGVDSSVTYKMVSAGMEMQITHVLVEHKEGESYTMRTDMVMGGNKTPGQPMKYVVKKPEPGKAPEGDKPQIEEGEETIKVAKGEFKCKWIKTTTKQGWSKVWTNDDVPCMRMVKMESEFSGAKTSMELVDFVKK